MPNLIYISPEEEGAPPVIGLWTQYDGSASGPISPDFITATQLERVGANLVSLNDKKIYGIGREGSTNPRGLLCYKSHFITFGDGVGDTVIFNDSAVVATPNDPTPIGWGPIVHGCAFAETVVNGTFNAYPITWFMGAIFDDDVIHITHTQVSTIAGISQSSAISLARIAGPTTTTEISSIDSIQLGNNDLIIAAASTPSSSDSISFLAIIEGAGFVGGPTSINTVDGTFNGFGIEGSIGDMLDSAGAIAFPNHLCKMTRGPNSNQGASLFAGKKIPAQGGSVVVTINLWETTTHPTANRQVVKFPGFDLTPHFLDLDTSFFVGRPTMAYSDLNNWFCIMGRGNGGASLGVVILLTVDQATGAFTVLDTLDLTVANFPNTFNFGLQTFSQEPHLEPDGSSRFIVSPVTRDAFLVNEVFSGGGSAEFVFVTVSEAAEQVGSNFRNFTSHLDGSKGFGTGLFTVRVENGLIVATNDNIIHCDPLASPLNTPTHYMDCAVYTGQTVDSIYTFERTGLFELSGVRVNRS